MTEEEVFKIARQHLLDHFPHCYSLWAFMCYEPGCKTSKCWECWFRRVRITPWEIECILPELEEEFGKKCSLKQPEFYDVVKFFADS